MLQNIYSKEFKVQKLNFENYILKYDLVFKADINLKNFNLWSGLIDEDTN